MLWRSSEFRKILVQDIALLTVFGGYLFASAKFRISCPILAASGFPCPTCGMTRAMFALMRLDFADYFRYNAFALPTAVAIILQLHKGLFSKCKTAVDVVSICIIILNFIYYIYRMLYIIAI